MNRDQALWVLSLAIIWLFFLPVGSRAEFLEPVDFGNTYETATLLPPGVAEIVGSAPQGDADFFIFQLPGPARFSDRFQLAVDVTRPTSAKFHRVIVYIGDHNIIGHADFYESGFAPINGQLLSLQPAASQLLVEFRGWQAPSPVDVDYRMTLTTTIVPEPSPAMMLAIAGVLGLPAGSRGQFNPRTIRQSYRRQRRCKK